MPALRLPGESRAGAAPCKDAIAITRRVSPSIGACELTHLERQPIDVALAERQHQFYEDALGKLGCEVVCLPAEQALPDAVFVEDTALVLDEAAVITRPGAESRRAETPSIERALKPYRKLFKIEPPGTLDGGDILTLGKRILVGISSRSNPSAIQQLRDTVKPFGYTVEGVPVQGCLHLKSAVTQAGEESLLLNSHWVDRDLFPGWRVIEVDESEPYGANVLWLGAGRIYPAQYPFTRQRLEAARLPVEAVDVSEVLKAEGAVTCCSLILHNRSSDYILSTNRHSSPY